VHDQDTGLLVDGTRPEAIAGALLRLLHEPALARGLAAAGLATAQARGWPMATARFLQACAPRAAPGAEAG
jgi:hypothetical protein